MQKDKIVRTILEALSKSDGLPFRYDHFRQSEAVNPPFAVYRRVVNDPFGADGLNYHDEVGCDLEVYAETPEDMEYLMGRIEELLAAQEVFYKKTADTVYIESEDFYESLYEL